MRFLKTPHYMKASVLILALLFCFRLANAQELPTQSFYVELGGAGLPYSMNYDFRFDKSQMDSWGMRVGIGGWILTGEHSSESLVTIPVQINKLLGKDKHYFEVGGGATWLRFRESYEYFNGTRMTTSTQDEYNFILNTGSTPTLMGTFSLGYRRIPTNGGFTFKANLNPVFNWNGFWPLWFGVGFGYAFH
jgi:hypothetical protein